MNTVRFGILGLGNMGSTHARNIMAEAGTDMVLTAVCDIKEARRTWAKETLGETVSVYSTCEEMLDSGVVDALIVAVPHYDHPKYAIMAMKRGIHVMVEKPAGVYTKQVNEMNAVADECGVVFGLMMNQRTNCIYRKMREIILSGELGEIRRTNWIIIDWYRSQAYYDSGDWRATWSGAGGGVLLNQFPHNIALWQWICGMPAKVRAKMHFGKWHNIEVEDDVSVYVEYPNGATGVFVTTTGDDPGTNRFEITCENGKLIAEGGKLTMWKTDISEADFLVTAPSPFARREFTMTEVETDGENPQHMGVLRAFVGNLLRGDKLVADGREGIRGLTLSNAMHLSAWLDRDIALADFPDDVFFSELMKRVEGSVKKTVSDAAVTADMGSTFGS